MIKQIIFDVYGTILESPESWGLYEGLLKDVGMYLRDHSVRDYYRRIGLTRNHKDLKAFLIDLHINVEGHEKVIKEYQDKLDDATAEIKVKKYSEKTLSLLRDKGYEIFALSNATRPYAEAFKRTALAPLMNGSMFSCYSGAMKPEREFFLKLIDSWDIHVNEAIMIGDSQTSDIAGAHSIGLLARRVAPKADYDILRVLDEETILKKDDIELITGD